MDVFPFSFLVLVILYVSLGVVSRALARAPGPQPLPWARAMKVITTLLAIALLVLVGFILVDYALHGSCDVCPDLD